MFDTIVTAPGSLGDVNPMIAIARGLQARGRRVVVATAERYLPLVQRAGLGTRVLVPETVFAQVVDNPNLWHPRKGLNLVFGSAGQGFLEEHYEWVARQYQPRRTLLVSHLLDFATRIFRDAQPDVPFCSVVPAPAVLRSLTHPPRLTPGGWELRLPKPLLAFAYRQADRILDRLAGRAINRIRTRHGLATVQRVMDRWWASPDLTLGLFPDWYSVPESDLPPGMRCVGFPLADSGDLLAEAGEKLVRDALAPLKGRRPIVFAPGSAHAHAKPFLAAAAEACRRLDEPGLLLSSVSGQFPDNLPSNVVTANYLPFTSLLPHARAMVHHGGIGTTSQALAAGVPQVVVPMAFDQFDNAVRVEAMGCGSWLHMTRVTPGRLKGHLSRALTDSSTSAAAQRAAARMTSNTITPTSMADILLSYFARRLDE